MLCEIYILCQYSLHHVYQLYWSNPLVRKNSMTNSISLEFLLYYHKIRMVMSFCFACSETEMDVRKQPKYITFLTQILLLFKFCPVCKEDDPRIRTREVGTMLEVKTVCQNVLCPKRINVWRSQPYIEGTNIPAGNLLLCFAILVAGGSATKVFRVFSHMWLTCLTLCTFFMGLHKHQRVSATPDYIYYSRKGQESFKWWFLTEDPLPLATSHQPKTYVLPACKPAFYQPASLHFTPADANTNYILHHKIFGNLAHLSPENDI